MSKQVSNNPRKFLPALRTTSKDYVALQTLALRIVAFMTANIAFYATPNPTLASVTTQIGNLKSAIGSGGSKWNRGSKASIELIRAEAETLRSMIIALISYAVNLTVTDDSQQTQALYNFLLSGLSVKKVRVITGAGLDSIRKFKIGRVGTGLESIELSWQKPKGMIKKQPAKMYKVEVFNPDNQSWFPIGETTKTKFTITSITPLLNLGEGTLRITPMSKNGFGQPYSFKVTKQLSSVPPPPFILGGALAMGVATNVHTENTTFPYPNITLNAVTTQMTYYLSTLAGALPIPGEPLIMIASGTPQTMSIQELKDTLEWNPTKTFLNVQNTGTGSGNWEVTLFV